MSTSSTNAGSRDKKPPRFNASESETLLGFADYLRESVLRKLDGLDEGRARKSSVASGTSLLWLVQHLTAAEVLWFQIRYAGLSETIPADALDPDAPVADHVAAYELAAARSNDIVRSSGSLAKPCADEEYAELPLLWVLVHMVEETARHAGHADIIREQLDGLTGR